MKKKIKYTKSSGNIFADLEFPNPQDMLTKVDLAIQINEIIKKKKLTQTQAAALLAIDQPKISALSKGKLSGFSLERLFRFLTILDQDITIKISPKKISKEKAKISVSLPKIKKEIPSKPSAHILFIQARKKKY